MDVQVQKVWIVADQVCCMAIHGAEQKGDVILIDRVVAKMEEFDVNDLCEESELAQKSQNGVITHASFA